MSKIEQIIEDLQSYIMGCKSPTFGGSGKIICDRSALEEFLDDLKLSTPEEIKKYQKIISQKDMIIADAKSQSNAIIAESKKEAQRMVDEHSIMQQAQAEAKEVLSIANDDANRLKAAAEEEVENYRIGIINYADETLSELQRLVADAIQEQENRHAALINHLRAIEERIAGDRQETDPAAAQQQAAADEGHPGDGFETIDDAGEEGEEAFLRNSYDSEE